MEKITRRRLRNFSLIFLVFVFISLFFTTESYLFAFLKEKPVVFHKELIWAFTRWMPWAFFTPLIFYLARRCDFRRQVLYRSILIHIIMSILLTALQAVIYIIYLSFVKNVPPQITLGTIIHFSLNFIHFNILTYWIIVSIFYMINYYRKSKEHQLTASKLETRLAQAQLEVLKMQLQPHFLFNTLHTISALVRKDAEASDKMICRLSDLLRMTLDNSGLQEVPLKEELEFLKIYLEIEQTRFGERLKIEMDIAPETLDAYVPNLILQPVVENAIKHGISPDIEGGTVKITSKQEDDKLIITVQDDGVGLKENADAVIVKGFGLSNTIERLKQLYGEEASLTIKNAEGGGVIGTFEIPLRIVNLKNQ